jgi:hypothetical protein
MDDFRFRPTFWFELRHDDGKVAAQTGHYFTGYLTPRQVNGYRLQMAKLLPRYEAYLAKYGKRWEVEQEEKRAAAKAIKQKQQRIEWLKKHIPLYTAELEELTRTKELA